jgi:hypothetical protein
MAQLTVDLAKIFKRTTTSLLIICFWALWATRAQAASDVLLYNPTNGAATIGRIDAGGQFAAQFHYPAGSFSANWSHIVRASNGLLFFYRQTDGFWAVGRSDANVGFVTLRTGRVSIYDARAGHLVPNFHVVSTPNGILISPGAMLSYTAEVSLIGQVRSDGHFQVTQYAKLGQWTNIVNTPNGVFFLLAEATYTSWPFAVGRVLANGTFSQTHSGIADKSPIYGFRCEVVAIGNDLVFLSYAREGLAPGLLDRQFSGHHIVGGISNNGQFARRNSTWCAAALAGGYIIPVVLGNDLLLYSVWDGNDYGYGLPWHFSRLVLGGWAQLSTFQQPSDFIPYACWGQLKTKYELPEGFFSRGWSRIVPTANGTLMHNPDDGATVVGSFNADGTFSQLSYNLLDVGYTKVINLTE